MVTVAENSLKRFIKGKSKNAKSKIWEEFSSQQPVSL